MQLAAPRVCTLVLFISFTSRKDTGTRQKMSPPTIQNGVLYPVACSVWMIESCCMEESHPDKISLGSSTPGIDRVFFISTVFYSTRALFFITGWAPQSFVCDVTGASTT